MQSKLLSIVIVNYASQQDMQKCLVSVYNKLNRNIDFEIVIVNNDRNEKLENIRCNFPQARIIDRGKNIGFGAGHNLGSKYINGEIILLLNPDTEILSENISEVFSQFNNDLRLGALGAQLVTKEGIVQKWSAGYETNLLDMARNNFKIPRSRKIWKSQKPIYADWVSGTALFVKKIFFKK